MKAKAPRSSVEKPWAPDQPGKKSAELLQKTPQIVSVTATTYGTTSAESISRELAD